MLKMMRAGNVAIHGTNRLTCWARRRKDREDGTTSIRETHGNRIVNRSIGGNRESGVFSQDEGNAQTGRRLVGTELQSAAADGHTDSVLLLSFGLKLGERM